MDGSGGHHIIIDGYNLLRNVAELKEREARDPEGARGQMLAKLEAYRAAKGARITVIFDGTPHYRPFGQLEVRYVPKADPEVVARASVGTIIVSNDHEVIDGARANGADALRCDEFWARVLQGTRGRSIWKKGRPPRATQAMDQASQLWAKDEDDDQPRRGTGRGQGKHGRRDRAAERRQQYVDDLLR